ncbi:MAG TPA: LuxR C-terminal-related transcriptional regulator [Acidobacteriaceae bacterium]|nr:LuxR C-terminal-related transcriptional regulator [Acidobacteriaceae bacterium]
MSKTASIDELVAAVRAVAQGRTVTVTTGAHSPRRPDSAVISEREREVLHLLAAGQRTAEISKRLSLSPRTVERHLADLRAKLDAHTSAELVRAAQERGLLPPGALTG